MVQQTNLVKQDKKQTIYHNKITSAMFITDYLITGTQDGFINIHYLLGMTVIYSRQISDKAILDIQKVPEKPFIVIRTSDSLLFFDDMLQQKQEILIKSQWLCPTAEFYSGLQKGLENQVVIPLEHNFIFALQSENMIQLIEYIEKQPSKDEEENQSVQVQFKIYNLFKNNWKGCVFTPQLNLFIAIDKNQNLSAYSINGKYFGTYNKQIKVQKLIHYQYNQYWFITVDNRVQIIDIELFTAQNYVKFNEHSVATKVVQTNDNSTTQNLHEIYVYEGYQPVVLDQEYRFDKLKMDNSQYKQQLLYLITVDNKCISYQQELQDQYHDVLITNSQLNLLQQNYVDCNDWEKINSSLNQFIQEIYNEQETTKELSQELYNRLQYDIELYREYGYDNQMFDKQMNDYNILSKQIQTKLHDVCINIIPTQAITGSKDINQDVLDFNQHNFKAYCKNFNFIDYITERQKVLNYCKDLLQKESKQQNDAILSYSGESQLLNIEQMSYMIYKGKPDWNTFTMDEDIEWSQYDELEELSEEDVQFDIDANKYVPLTENPQPAPPIYIDLINQYEQPDLSIFDTIQLQEIEQGEQFEKYEEKIDYDLPEVKYDEINTFVNNMLQKCTKNYNTRREINIFINQVITQAEKQAEVQQGVKQFINQIFQNAQEISVIKQNEWIQQSKIFANQCIQQAQNQVIAQRKAERIKKEQERKRLLEEERQRKLEEERLLKIKLEQERIAKLQQQFQDLTILYEQKSQQQFNQIQEITFSYKQVKTNYKNQVKQLQKNIQDQIIQQKIKEEQERQKQLQLEREKAKKEAEERKKLLKQKQLEEKERQRLEQEQLKAQKEKERQEKKQLQEQKAKMMEQKRKEAELAKKSKQNKKTQNKNKYEDSYSYDDQEYSYDNYSYSYSYSEEQPKPKQKQQPKQQQNKRFAQSDSQSSSEIIQNKKKQPIKKQQKEEYSYSPYSYSYSEESSSQQLKTKNKVTKQQNNQPTKQTKKPIKEDSYSYSTEESSIQIKQNNKQVKQVKQNKYSESSSSEIVKNKQSQKQQQQKKEKQEQQEQQQQQKQTINKKRLLLSESSSSDMEKEKSIISTSSVSEKHNIKQSTTNNTKQNVKNKYESSSEDNKQKKLVNITQQIQQKQQKKLLDSESSSSIDIKQKKKQESSSESIKQVKQQKQVKQIQQKKQIETSSSSSSIVVKQSVQQSNQSQQLIQSQITTTKTTQQTKRFDTSESSQQNEKPAKVQTKQQKLLVESSEEIITKKQVESSTESERKQIRINNKVLIKQKGKYDEHSSSSSVKIIKRNEKKNETINKQKVETSSSSEDDQPQNLLQTIKQISQKVQVTTQQIVQKITNKEQKQTNEIVNSKQIKNEIIEELMEESSEKTADIVVQNKINIQEQQQSSSEEEQLITQTSQTVISTTQQMTTNDILEHHQQIQVNTDKELLHKINSISASNQLIYASLCRYLQLQAFDIITDDMLKLISYYWPPSARINKQFVLLPTHSNKSAWDTLLPAYDMVNHKRLSCKQLPPNLSQLQFIRTYRALRHEGILKYQGCGWSQYNQLYIFTDETPQIKLIDCFNNQQLFNSVFSSQNAIKSFIKQLVNTIVFLNSPQNRLMHRDLRPSTIYINKQNMPCLYHIGFMQSLNCNEAIEVNTVFAAPEVVCGSCFLSSDTWSIGTLTLLITLYSLCQNWEYLQQFKLFTNDLIQHKKECPAGWQINEANNAKIILQMAQTSKDAVKIKNQDTYQIVKETYFETYAKNNKIKQQKSYRACIGHLPYETVQQEGFQLSNIFEILRNYGAQEDLINFIKQCYVFDATKRVRCNSLLESQYLSQSEDIKQNIESSDEEFMNKFQKQQTDQEAKQKQKKVVKKIVRRLVKRQ